MYTHAVLSVQNHFLQPCRWYEAQHHESAWRHAVCRVFWQLCRFFFTLRTRILRTATEREYAGIPPVRILTALIRPTDTIKGNCMSKYISANHASIVCILLTGTGRRIERDVAVPLRTSIHYT